MPPRIVIGCYESGGGLDCVALPDAEEIAGRRTSRGEVLQQARVLVAQRKKETSIYTTGSQNMALSTRLRADSARSPTSDPTG